MQFPFLKKEKGIVSKDFDLFHEEFSQIALQLIPYAEGPVSFLGNLKEEENGGKSAFLPDAWRKKIQAVVKNARPLVNKANSMLYLPIWNGEGVIGAAVIEGVEASFIHSLSLEWLIDRSRIISRELYFSKQLSYDPASGFLNIRYLERELFALLYDNTPFSLTLIEVYPKASNSEKARQYISKAAYYLSSSFQQQPLIHIDAGIFAFLWPEVDSIQSQKIGKIIIDLLKREEFSRAHLGMTTFKGDAYHGKQAKNDFEISTQKIIDQAWQSLRIAIRRGPYALFQYHSIVSSSNHPLAKPPAFVQRKLRDIAKNKDHFAIVYFQLSDEMRNESFMKRILSLGGESSHIYIIGQAGYALIEYADSESALEWATTLNAKITTLGYASLTMGVAVYPTGKLKKADMLLSAKKAFLHTQFYGPGTITLFDAVSQNVSGDVFYREGDLNRAVKEYRVGLSLEPSNVNLLNSLGEAYAQMNRHKEAIEYFTKALQENPKDYMALFNLGVVHSKLKNERRAIKYFEKAHQLVANNGKYTKGSEHRYDVSHDLLLPLARLYSKTSKHKKIIELLSGLVPLNGYETSNTEKKGLNPAGLFRYLGRAYKEEKMNQDAIVALQKAVNHNPRDATSISLLGELYLLEKQGDKIALSFCKQAVELNNTRWDYWFRLGRIYFQCNEVHKAKDAFLESLARNKNHVNTLLFMGKTCSKLKDWKQAKKMYRMVLKQQPQHKQAARALNRLDA